MGDQMPGMPLSNFCGAATFQTTGFSNLQYLVNTSCPFCLGATDTYFVKMLFLLLLRTNAIRINNKRLNYPLFILLLR